MNNLVDLYQSADFCFSPFPELGHRQLSGRDVR